MTNSVSIFQWASDKVNQLDGAPVWLLVVIFSLCVGYTLKWIKRFPNNLIPLPVVLGAALANSILMSAVRPPGVAFLAWATRQFIVGLVLGFVTWLLHHYVIKRIEARFPFVKDAISEAGLDTAPPFPLDPPKPPSTQ